MQITLHSNLSGFFYITRYTNDKLLKKQVNIICTHHERPNMASSNLKTLIKGNWDSDNNTGDHRPVTMKLGIAACREFLNKL